MASKYKSLTDYLRESKQVEVKLTFAEIEHILGATLPQSAYKSPAWWANSRTEDSHGWAHLWLAAGWASSGLDLKTRSVIFRRSSAIGSNEVSPIAALYPQRLEHLMDILVQANIDVSAWGFTTEGREVEHPKANPDYCYDWSFGSEDEGFVLCVWCDLLDENGQRVSYSENMQEHARELERAARDRNLGQDKRSRVQQQARRARAFDDAVDFSFRKGRPVKVILTAGDLRSRNEIVEKSSKVALRSLDNESWFVHRYSRDTGECLMVRGLLPESSFLTKEKEFDVSDDSPGADDYKRMAEVAQRRGQAEFRQSLLAAYSRRCAVTGSTVVELLEAAHIIPHSEERNYRVTNGLLLRADIHTLFDLYLLSIDARGLIHISKSLATSEYWQYNGKQLKKMADSIRDQPYATSLQSRHERFLAKEQGKTQNALG